MVGTIEVSDEYVSACKGAQRAVRYLLLADNAAAALGAPLARLAAHDAATYDSITRTGGPNGTIRVERELARPENAGLEPALRALEVVKSKFDAVTYADLIQIAGATAIEMVGGPIIDVRVGRKDSKACPPSGRVPDGSKGPEAVKKAFLRTGLSASEAAALLGGMQFGAPAAGKGTGALAMDPLDLGTAYLAKVTAAPAEDPITELLQQDDEMRRCVTRWQEDGDAFLADFGAAFKKLSEVGCKDLVRQVKGAARAAASTKKERPATASAGDMSFGSLAQVLEDPYMLAGAAVAAGAAYFFLRRRKTKA